MSDKTRTPIKSAIETIDNLLAINEALEAELALWKADAERLAKDYYQEYFYDTDKCYCKFCDVEAFTPDEIIHSPACPITLHRELVAKYGGEHE